MFLPFWEDLSAIHKRALGSCQVSNYSSGEKILISPTERNGFLLVLRGGICVYISSEGGREFTLYRVSAGGMCTLLPVDGPGIPTVEADGSCALVHFPAALLQPILTYLPDTLDFFLGRTADNLQSVLSNIEYSFFGTLRSSVARLILENCPADSNAVRITHEQLVNHIGTTREVVSREIESFRDLGLISAGRGVITIIDRDGLRGISGR